MDSYTLKNIAHYARAVLTDAGVVIKSQGWGSNLSQVEDEFKPQEYNYHVLGVNDKKSKFAVEKSLYSGDGSSSSDNTSCINVSGLLELSETQSSASNCGLLQQKQKQKQQSKGLSSGPASLSANGDDKAYTSATCSHEPNNFNFLTCCISSDSTSFSNTDDILIPYTRILMAKSIGTLKAMGNIQLVELAFVVPYKKDLIPKRQRFLIEPSNYQQNQNQTSVVETILSRSYQGVRRDKSIIVIINPFSGKGKAKKLYLEKCHPILKETNWNIDIKYTEYAQHATDIARTLDLDKYDTVVCASGDGIPYEVINGLYQRPDRVRAFNELTITQLPCGSGNAMSISCHWTENPSYAALCLTKSRETRVDVMSCSQSTCDDDGTLDTKLSFLSQTYGVIAESDINTEWIRWMGPIRFDLGVAFTVAQKRRYPCDIYVKYAAKHKHDLHNHYIREKRRHLGQLKANPFSESVSAVPSSSSTPESPVSPSMSPLSSDIPLLSSASSSSLSSASASSLQASREDIGHKVTENDFNLKYTMKNTSTIPDDWEQINPDITENLQIFYTGKMPYVSKDTNFFPTALPNDGTIDLVITDSRTPFSRMSSILLNLDKGSHVLQPEVVHAKVTAYKLVPRPLKKSVISVDGERFPVKPLLVEVIPGLVKTLLRDGNFIDTEFESILS